MQTPLCFPAALLLQVLWVIPLSAIQNPSPSIALLQQHVPTSVNIEMADHQQGMQTLTARLNHSAQVIADARDAKGYVRDKAIMEAHDAAIKALQNSFRDHKKFLKTYESACGVKGKQHDAMIQHQQMMKSVLYDVVETFDTFEASKNGPNDLNIEHTKYVGPAFEAHRDA